MSYEQMTKILTPRVLGEYDGFIYDMDGTLIETLTAHANSWIEAGREFGYDFDPQIMVDLTGAKPQVIVEAMMRKVGMDLSLFDQVLETKIRIAKTNLLRDSYELPAYKLACELKDKAPQAIGTGSFRIFLDLLDTKYHIYDLFGREHTISMEDVIHHKPHPETFLTAAKSLAVEPTNCLVFEDGSFGIQAALYAGMDAYDVVHNQLYRAEDYRDPEKIDQIFVLRPAAEAPRKNKS